MWNLAESLPKELLFCHVLKQNWESLCCWKGSTISNSNSEDKGWLRSKMEKWRVYWHAAKLVVFKSPVNEVPKRECHAVNSNPSSSPATPFTSIDLFYCCQFAFATLHTTLRNCKAISNLSSKKKKEKSREIIHILCVWKLLDNSLLDCASVSWRLNSKFLAYLAAEQFDVTHGFVTAKLGLYLPT